jgi:hypothetical protein
MSRLDGPEDAVDLFSMYTPYWCRLGRFLLQQTSGRYLNDDHYTWRLALSSPRPSPSPFNQAVPVAICAAPRPVRRPCAEPLRRRCQCCRRYNNKQHCREESVVLWCCGVVVFREQNGVRPVSLQNGPGSSDRVTGEPLEPPLQMSLPTSTTHVLSILGEKASRRVQSLG